MMMLQIRWQRWQWMLLLLMVISFSSAFSNDTKGEEKDANGSSSSSSSSSSPECIVTGTTEAELDMPARASVASSSDASDSSDDDTNNMEKNKNKSDLDDESVFVFETIHGPVQIVSDDSGHPSMQDHDVERHLRDCGLWLAESAIPNAGWGMYTGKALKKGDTIQPTDVAIHVSDQPYHQKMINKISSRHETKLPRWVMIQYYWNARVTFSDWDAHSVDAIIPSFGMLANSHTGLVNLNNVGAQRWETTDRHAKHTGAYTTYRDMSFDITMDLPEGHELFADYGDSWFEEREYIFGPIPLSKDYKKADEILENVQSLCNHTLTTDFCHDLWHLTRVDAKDTMSERVLAALPESISEVHDIVHHKQGSTAYHSLPNVIRDKTWLQRNGMCLDHMIPAVSNINKHKDGMAGMGAMATRFLPKGTVVAPAPLIHMHKDHLAMLVVDSNDPDRVFWQGHQLLLNYCYGHAKSSMVFFPYSPVTNFINHSSKKPNVVMRWSSRMKRKDWLDMTTAEVLANDKYAGLMLEFVALRDIVEGEEILLDYGSSWEAAWNAFQFESPTEIEGYQEAHEIENMKKIPKEGQLPPNVMTVCWVDTDTMEHTDETEVYLWTKTRTKFYDEAQECMILKRHTEDKTTLYDVRYKFDTDVYIVVKDLPRRAIAIVDRPYSKNQYLRGAFRHEIHIPDEIMPKKWRDLEEYPKQCGLYMAESAIPNSGLGMFTAKPILNARRIFHGLPVIQVADYKVNRRLRHWANDIKDDEKEPVWLMENYFWNSDVTMGEWESAKTYSIVPGLGMLANSHPGLVNANMKRPTIDMGGIHRSRDPSAGASTNFHDLSYVADGYIEAGAELFVEYGDSWFKDRTNLLGLIPLSTDFTDADALLQKFNQSVGGDFQSEMAKDLWNFLWETSAEKEDNRVRVALPKSLEDVPAFLETGTAKASVPNRVRSPEWLAEHGLCLDNIEPKMSTIPGAHHGAFATRPLQQGQIIAPAPVVHLQRKSMEIWNSKDVKDPKEKPWFEGQQLLLNYCFGHANSSVLLFPYSPTVNYINHDHHKFNAELRWSSVETAASIPQREEFKALHPDDLMRFDHAGLVMEIVATRDIQVGEEVLLNYGTRWEHAWRKHQSKWSPVKKAKKYVAPSELNDFLTPIRTLKEQKKNPYPANVFTACYIRYNKTRVDKNKKGESIHEWTYKHNMYQYTDDAYPCDVLSRHSTLNKYINNITETILQDSTEPPLHTYSVRFVKHDKNDNKKKIIIRHVPRRAIEFFDDEYESDLSLPNAFRHEMELPDHMLPIAWNDLDTPLE